MKTSSAKAKGRLLQQIVANGLTECLAQFGIEEGDFRSVSMGASGEDIILSPAAKKLVGDLRIECKNVEALNVVTIFWEHTEKYQGKPTLLVHKRNKTKPLATITLERYLELLTNNVKHSQNNSVNP